MTAKRKCERCRSSLLVAARLCRRRPRRRRQLAATRHAPAAPRFAPPARRREGRTAGPPCLFITMWPSTVRPSSRRNNAGGHPPPAAASWPAAPPPPHRSPRRHSTSTRELLPATRNALIYVETMHQPRHAGAQSSNERAQPLVTQCASNRRELAKLKPRAQRLWECAGERSRGWAGTPRSDGRRNLDHEGYCDDHGKTLQPVRYGPERGRDAATTRHAYAVDLAIPSATRSS